MLCLINDQPCLNGRIERMRVLYIEDEKVLANLVRMSLKPLGFAVDHMETADDGLAALDATNYDAVLLDLNLPDEDGIQVLRRLRARRDDTPVLILSARRNTDQRILGLDAGADDYLPKPFQIPELAARLRALARRPRKLLGTELACGNLVYLPAEHTALVDGTPVPLPRRVASVLEHLIRNVGRPVSKSALEDKLYSYGEEVASNSVEVHVHALRKRLAAAGASVRVETRRGTGYVLVAKQG
jgi:DNA-binding response OmpR family regulator